MTRAPDETSGLGPEGLDPEVLSLEMDRHQEVLSLERDPEVLGLKRDRNSLSLENTKHRKTRTEKVKSKRFRDGERQGGKRKKREAAAGGLYGRPRSGRAGNRMKEERRMRERGGR